MFCAHANLVIYLCIAKFEFREKIYFRISNLLKFQISLMQRPHWTIIGRFVHFVDDLKSSAQSNIGGEKNRHLSVWQYWATLLSTDTDLTQIVYQCDGLTNRCRCCSRIYYYKKEDDDGGRRKSLKTKMDILQFTELLLNDGDSFKNFFRMTKSDFEELLTAFAPKIIKRFDGHLANQGASPPGPSVT